MRDGHQPKRVFREQKTMTLLALAVAGLLASTGAQAAYEFRVPLAGMRPATCLTPWGEVLINGQQKNGYSVSSVPYGQSCSPTPVSCQNGTLIGTAPFGACAVGAAANCTLPWDGSTLQHGTAYTGGTVYAASSVPPGNSCSTQVAQLTCDNGTLSIPNPSLSCAASCATAWGAVVPSGSSATVYQSGTVPFGSTCVAVSNQCQNGTWAYPQYTAQTCEVSAPVWDNVFNAALKGTWTTHTNGLTEGLYGNVGSSFGAYPSAIDGQRDGIATKGHATGKWYFEMSSTDGYFRPGLYSGPSDTYIWAGPQATTGSLVSLAADLDAGVLYAYDGACLLIGSRTFTTGKTFYPAWQGGGAFSRSQTVTANFGGSAFRCAPPAGYNPGY